MLGHHAIILTDASVAFLPECVSCDFAKSKCRSLGAMKGTTPRKMIPLCMVSVSLCCSNTFPLLNIVFNWHFWFVSLCPGAVCLFQFRFGFCMGPHITLSEVDVIDCEAKSTVVGFVFVKIHSVQSICVGYLLSWRVLQLIVETH